VPATIALLRAVNLGPTSGVPVAGLCQMVAGLGFGEVRSLLRTGNLVFHAGGARGAALERRLEKATAATFGLATDYFVRTAAEWDAAIAANPMPGPAAEDASHFLLFALKEAPAEGALDRLAAAIKGREVPAIDGRHAYVHFPDGIGTSRLTHKAVEKALGVRATGRNWNTVLKLQAMARA
jgi:uncharacterized protein (DUF1697 family)